MPTEQEPDLHLQEQPDAQMLDQDDNFFFLGFKVSKSWLARQPQAARDMLLGLLAHIGGS